MQLLSTLPIYITLLLAALAGSLHCIGMCGPILVGFSQSFVATTPLTVNGSSTPATSMTRDFVWYHAGRIWTYAMLGLLAGGIGQQFRDASTIIGWQRPASIMLGVAVVLSGIALAGVIPGLKLDAGKGGCGIDKLSRFPLLASLVRGQGVAPRLLLGVIMGLLPCGLVYAMLVTVASLPSPVHAAAGMVVFGIGTLPSLTLVLLATNLVPARWRVHGSRLAAVCVILTGVFMLGRATLLPENCHGVSAVATTKSDTRCAHCTTQQTSPAPATGR